MTAGNPGCYPTTATCNSGSVKDDPGDRVVVGSAAKGKLENLIRPVGRALADLGISANFFTGLGFGLSCLAAYLIATGHIRASAAVIVVAGLCDVLDGAVARAKGTVTRAGAFLDSTLDRYSEIAIFLGVIWFYVSPDSGNASPLMAVVAMLALGGSIMVSYTRARAEGVDQECKIGIAERPERFVILIVGTLFGPTGLRVSLWILAVVSNITALQRMTYVMRKLSKSVTPGEGNQPSSFLEGDGNVGQQGQSRDNRSR